MGRVPVGQRYEGRRWLYETRRMDPRAADPLFTATLIANLFLPRDVVNSSHGSHRRSLVGKNCVRCGSRGLIQQAFFQVEVVMKLPVRCASLVFFSLLAAGCGTSDEPAAPEAVAQVGEGAAGASSQPSSAPSQSSGTPGVLGPPPRYPSSAPASPGMPPGPGNAPPGLGGAAGASGAPGDAAGGIPGAPGSVPTAPSAPGGVPTAPGGVPAAPGTPGGIPTGPGGTAVASGAAPQGAAQGASSQPGPDLAIGKVAPEIEGEDVNGKSFKLSDYRGKVVVLDFWGDW
jgi:hypothetical protein